MKQVIEQEKAWDMVRGVEKADGQIVAVTIHVQASEGAKSVDFFETARTIIDEGFGQPRGRAVIVWGERAMSIANSANLWLYYGNAKAAQLLTTCRNLAGKAGFGEVGRLRVTCSLEYPGRNQIVTLHDMSYPPRGGECLADMSPLHSFKAVSSSGEFTFRTVHELKKFLKTVKGAETYVFDEKAGKWARWVEVEQTEDKLVINIPTPKGRRQILVDLTTGRIEEEK